MDYRLSFCNGRSIGWSSCGARSARLLAKIAACCGWESFAGGVPAEAGAFLHDGAPPGDVPSPALWPQLFHGLFRVVRPGNAELHFYLERDPETPRELLFFRRSISFLPLARLLAGDDAALVHGAVASKGNRGILICGASGAGKSTSIRRLPDAEWEKHCDDALLLIFSPISPPIRTRCC